MTIVYNDKNKTRHDWENTMGLKYTYLKHSEYFCCFFYSIITVVPFELLDGRFFFIFQEKFTAIV